MLLKRSAGKEGDGQRGEGKVVRLESSRLQQKSSELFSKRAEEKWQKSGHKQELKIFEQIFKTFKNSVNSK